MLLFDYSGVKALVGATVLSLALSGCQVRPLYSDSAPNSAGVTTNSALNSVAVAPAYDRVAQEVRNHLIFGLSGGAGEPASSAYTVDLGVTQQVLSVASAPVVGGNSTQPTAGSVVLTSLYLLKDASGQQIASGKRTATVSFDRPIQQYAALRALRDAENRAARELAEMLKLALAADLAK
ncbi:MAG: LPS assembly lipoprotein LptE [Rhizobiaceae bacterium]